eukprot:1815999-Rhodomonas_salina.1
MRKSRPAGLLGEGKGVAETETDSVQYTPEQGGCLRSMCTMWPPYHGKLMHCRCLQHAFQRHAGISDTRSSVS